MRRRGQKKESLFLRQKTKRTCTRDVRAKKQLPDRNPSFTSTVEHFPSADQSTDSAPEPALYIKSEDNDCILMRRCGFCAQAGDRRWLPPGRVVSHCRTLTPITAAASGTLPDVRHARERSSALDPGSAGVNSTLWLARVPHGRRTTAANNIHFYDRSNEFYRQFLDSRMLYSCAYSKRLVAS